MSSVSKEKRRNEIVLPGDRVAVVEEFSRASGVYEDKDGYLRSALVGIVSADVNSKTISLNSLSRVKTVRRGSNVFGIVSSVRQDIVTIDIYGLVTISGNSLGGFVELSGLLTGLLPISQVANEFINDLYDYYRPGDLVVAKALNNNNPYVLTTKSPQYGVLYAMCSKCLSLLKPIGSKSMTCSNCGNIESRKVSTLAPSNKVIPIGLRFLLGLKRW
ncbi:MAG: exosome complex RNA-binding protein Csl4 [Acidilobaceae archaeon]